MARCVFVRHHKSDDDDDTDDHDDDDVSDDEHSSDEHKEDDGDDEPCCFVFWLSRRYTFPAAFVAGLAAMLCTIVPLDDVCDWRWRCGNAKRVRTVGVRFQRLVIVLSGK